MGGERVLARRGTHVANVDVAYTARWTTAEQERGGEGGRRGGVDVSGEPGSGRKDARLDIEKWRARNIRLRGIVSHCAAQQVCEQHGEPRPTALPLTQTRETAVVILHMGIWDGEEEVPVSSGGA